VTCSAIWIGNTRLEWRIFLTVNYEVQIILLRSVCMIQAYLNRNVLKLDLDEIFVWYQELNYCKYVIWPATWISWWHLISSKTLYCIFAIYCTDDQLCRNSITFHEFSTLYSYSVIFVIYCTDDQRCRNSIAFQEFSTLYSYSGVYYY
jgi:hypothetical protein